MKRNRNNKGACPSGWKDVHLAVYQNNIDALQEWLGENAGDLRLEEPLCHYDANSPALPLLHVAAWSGNELALEVLLDAGADVNYAEPAEDTVALFYAAKGGHTSAIEVLLRRGAFPNLSNAYGFTPLMVASLYRRGEAQRRLAQCWTFRLPTGGEYVLSDSLSARIHLVSCVLLRKGCDHNVRLLVLRGYLAIEHIHSL